MHARNVRDLWFGRFCQRHVSKCQMGQHTQFSEWLSGEKQMFCWLTWNSLQVIAKQSCFKCFQYKSITQFAPFLLPDPLIYGLPWIDRLKLPGCHARERSNQSPEALRDPLMWIGTSFLVDEIFPQPTVHQYSELVIFLPNLSGFARMLLESRKSKKFTKWTELVGSL